MDANQLAKLVAKVLKEELRENEHTREQGLEQFRDWILKNPDIRDCPTDDAFLLPFLRVRKYSVPMAEQTLMRLLTIKKNFPELNSNLDIQDPEIYDAISSGFTFACPVRDRNGQTVALSIPRYQDLQKHTYQIAYRTFFLNFHALSLRESTQVLGFTLIIDYNDISPAYFTSFPTWALKALLEAADHAFPLRIKKIHLINLPSIAMWLLNLVLMVISEKMRARLLFHNSLEELYNHVDRSVLPKEYGGTMPMKEMIELWKEELAVHREATLAFNNIKLVGDSFKNDLGSNDSGISALPGSFRKLQVD